MLRRNLELTCRFIQEVKFYDKVDDALLKFAVIISQSNGKWVFCKHKERDTYKKENIYYFDGDRLAEL